MGKTSRIGLLWDSVSDNMGDQAIGLILQRALAARGLPLEVVDPFVRTHRDLAMLVIGGGELIRTPGDPFYDAFRVPGKHILNAVGVLDGAATDYLADYRLVTSRSRSDQAKLSRGEIYPDLTLLFGDYLDSESLDIEVPREAVGIHVMPSRPEEGLALANWLRKADLGPILWIPITHYANDEALLQVLAEYVPGSVLLPKLPPDDIFKLIGRLRLLVTASLHGTLFAYAQDVPFISIQRYSKLGYFLSERRLDEHLVKTAADLQNILPRWLDQPLVMNTERALDQMRCRELVDRICAHAEEALSQQDPLPIISLPPTNRHLHEQRMHFGSAEGIYIADLVSQNIALQSGARVIRDLNTSISNYGRRTGRMETDSITSENPPRQNQFVNHLTGISPARFAKQVIHKAFRRIIGGPKIISRKTVSPQLIFAVETNLTEPVYVGKGVAFPLQGWCYSQRSLTRNLEILVNGVPHKAIAHSRARMDIFNNQCPALDQSGHSLLSGFNAVLPFHEVKSSEHIQLGLRAILEDDSVVEQTIGFLELRPSPEVHPLEFRWSEGQGRVAICMTTYNPKTPLFVKQIESIRNQTYTNWRCIISDDVSSEDSRREMRNIIKGDHRFILVENELPVGFYRNFERCLRFVPQDTDFVALSDHDDVWFPDKIQSLLDGFHDDTQLVYSDMQIIDQEDKVLLNTFWVTRKNNCRNLPAMLFANTITGAASMFRASLIPMVLPFPERMIDAYHDHWLGLSALVKGKIQFINRPLYAYRQHNSNIIGHRNENSYPNLFQIMKTLAKAGVDRMQRQTIVRSILENAGYAYPSLIHKIVLARTLLLRQPEAAPRKKRFLNRIVRLERSLRPLIGESIRAAVSHRPSLGLEPYHLRIALGVRLWDLYFRSQKDRLLQTQMQRAQAAASSMPILSGNQSGSRGGLPMLQAIRYGHTQWISSNLSPLTLDISEAHPRRVNLLMATIDFQYVYGGYIGMFNFALKLKRTGYRTRIILTEKTEFDLEKWRQQVYRCPGLADLFDEVEILYRYDRAAPVPVHPHDTFVATSCWTAHVAHRAMRDLKRERFTFLVQDYEPMFVPMNSIHAIFMQAYTFPQYNLFSTEFLREYFHANRIGIFKKSENEGNALSISFQNAINRFSIAPDQIRRGRKKLLFYARPEPHAARNLFELGMMSLIELLRADEFDCSHWTFHGIGSINFKMPLQLAPNVQLKLMPRTELQEYIDLLPTFDVGLSLMLTPHPSLVPLEMASAGLWTVTNTFANKTADKLKAISSNLIAVPPTIDGIKEGLLQAIRSVDAYDQRIAGTQVNWATDWEESFNPQIMEKLKNFLD